MRVRWHHIPTGIAWGIGLVGSIALLAFNFLASGGATVLHWMGWW